MAEPFVTLASVSAVDKKREPLNGSPGAPGTIRTSDPQIRSLGEVHGAPRAERVSCPDARSLTPSGAHCEPSNTGRRQSAVSLPAPLAPGQHRVLQAIEQAIAATGFPPTIRELADRLDFASTNGVAEHLRALERKGYLRREGLRARAMTVLVPSAGAVVLPEKRGRQS